MSESYDRNTLLELWRLNKPWLILPNKTNSTLYTALNALGVFDLTDIAARFTDRDYLRNLYARYISEIRTRAAEKKCDVELMRSRTLLQYLAIKLWNYEQIVASILKINALKGRVTERTLEYALQELTRPNVRYDDHPTMSMWVLNIYGEHDDGIVPKI